MKAEITAYLQNSTTVRFSGWREHALPAGFRALSGLAPELAATVAERIFLTPPRYAAPAHETQALAEAHRSHFLMEGREIAAWSWGDGPTIFLMHGWGGRGGQMHAFVEPLLASGFSVVLFDAPGHGETGGTETSLVHFSKALEAAAAWAGPAYAVIAHSMGAAATAHAVREGLRAKKLAFVAPPTTPDRFSRELARKIGMPEEVLRRMKARIARRVGVPWDELSIPRIAPSMEIPLFIAHDRGDKEVPWSAAAEIAGMWPGARLLTTEGLGHRRILKAPEVVGSVVAFLKE